MAVYQYVALDERGKKNTGIVDADSMQGARRRLREMGLHPTRVTETDKTDETDRQISSVMRMRRPVSREICLVTRQWSVLLEAGMQLIEALSCVLEQIDHPRLTKVVYDVRERVRQGSTFADALAAHPKEFSELYVNMVRAGEKSGSLDIILARLADYLENQAKLIGRLRSALIYPILMVMFGGGIVSFLMGYIVPKISDMFQRTNQKLPPVTEILMSISGFIRHEWYIIVFGTLAVIVGIRTYMRTETGRKTWHKLQLRLPLFGELALKMAVSRFARTLGTLLEGGISMLGALSIVKGLVRNAVLEAAIEETEESVRRGQSLVSPLRRAEVFPPMLLHMVALGERSGQLEKMLIKVADTYDEDVDTTVNALVSLVEPLLIIAMGIVVAFIVMAVLLPIMDLSANVM